VLADAQVLADRTLTSDEAARLAAAVSSAAQWPVVSVDEDYEHAGTDDRATDDVASDMAEDATKASPAVAEPSAAAATAAAVTSAAPVSALPARPLEPPTANEFAIDFELLAAAASRVSMQRCALRGALPAPPPPHRLGINVCHVH
jgi:hypothetical protein